MFRKYVIVSIAALFFLSTACTSKKAHQDDSADADVEASVDDESLETAEATENNSDLESAPSEDVAADNSGDALAPEEKLPEDTGDTTVAENAEVAPGDLSETPPADQPPPSDLAANEETPPADQPAMDAPPSDQAAMDVPPADPAMDAATPEPATPTPEPAVPEAPKPVASLQKVKAQPYKDHKVLVNAIYIARQGDTVESISQKIFASKSHVKDICKVNSYNCSRPIKVGDKFYYNSPQRPNDDQVVKTFYEDAGIAPQVYTAKAGDNIRVVGKELLGHERSWMELWATNDVESKNELDEGTQLKYWPNSEVAAPTQTLAENTPPAPGADGSGAGSMDQTAQAEAPATEDPMAQEAPPPQDMAMNPPAEQQPQEALPPAPDANQQAAAQGSVEPPPPPPPPPPMAANHNGQDMSAADPNQQTFMLGVGAVLLLAAAALFISIRKRRQKRSIDFNTATQTQIE